MQVYAHPRYAESLSEFGTPRHLPESGGTVLIRPVPGFPDHDAMGCYPIFSCEDWYGLSADLEGLGDGLVSLGVVADPHGECPVSLLKECFDTVRPFKEHYLVDLTGATDRIGHADHRRKARRALRDLEVEVCTDPAGFLDEWCTLYETLIERHGISGIRAFSRRSFERQLALPGVDVIQAMHGGRVVGALIMFRQNDVLCGHLCAMNETGYRLRATYALDWFSFGYYAGKARCIDLGGGMVMGGKGGLDHYKRGWASHTVPVHFCGRILNPHRYKVISEAAGAGSSRYFPAYRSGEYA